jgi:hypothetical protein
VRGRGGSGYPPGPRPGPRVGLGHASCAHGPPTAPGKRIATAEAAGARVGGGGRVRKDGRARRKAQGAAGPAA